MCCTRDIPYRARCVAHLRSRTHQREPGDYRHNPDRDSKNDKDETIEGMDVMCSDEFDVPGAGAMYPSKAYSSVPRLAAHLVHSITKCLTIFPSLLQKTVNFCSPTPSRSTSKGIQLYWEFVPWSASLRRLSLRPCCSGIDLIEAQIDDRRGVGRVDQWANFDNLYRWSNIASTIHYYYSQ